MPTSRDLPADRLAIGQLLGRLLREFRVELFAPADEHGYPDILLRNTATGDAYIYYRGGI